MKIKQAAKNNICWFKLPSARELTLLEQGGSSGTNSSCMMAFGGNYTNVDDDDVASNDHY